MDFVGFYRKTVDNPLSCFGVECVSVPLDTSDDGRGAGNKRCSVLGRLAVMYAVAVAVACGDAVALCAAVSVFAWSLSAQRLCCQAMACCRVHARMCRDAPGSCGTAAAVPAFDLSDHPHPPEFLQKHLYHPTPARRKFFAIGPFVLLRLYRTALHSNASLW